MKLIWFCVTSLLLTVGSHARSADSNPVSSGGLRSAPAYANPLKGSLIAAARAGKRVVAVGDYGVVLLSDDGKGFRQAKSVPTRTVLTSVFFLDDKQGWAAGHDGTVLGSADGGETWRVLREEPGKDRVLLSVWFENSSRGMAIGQFGLVLETVDGGKTWQERKLVDGEMGDRHLLQIFPGEGRLVVVAAEAGAVFRSEDAGRSWKAIQTDNKGSFWTGMSLKDGTLIVAGMRGHVYRSVDRGMSWYEVPSHTQQSLTTVVQRGDGQLFLYGNSGVWLASRDNCQSLLAEVRPDRVNVTAAVANGATDILFALSGVVDVK